VDTATQRSPSDQAFHANDFEEAVEYRSLSVLAIISLLFGLASPLCLASRFLLLIPLLGIVVSIIALIRIAASDGLLAGRGAAIVGLALCVAFGTAQFTRTAFMRYIQTSQAREHGEKWLSVLASGRTEDAFRATFEGARPEPPPDPHAPPVTTTPYDEFIKLDEIKRIASAGKDAKITFQGTKSYDPQGRGRATVRQQFQVTPADDKAEPVEVDLTIQRSSFMGEANIRWLVIKYEPPTDTPL
jgi:hypothetical protein